MKEDRRGSLRGRSWTCLEPPGGEAPVMEIDGDGAVAVAGKTTRWRGCGGLQLEPDVVGDADEADEALKHILAGRGRLRRGGRGSRGRGVAPLSPPGAVGERVRRRPSPCSDLVA